MPAILPKIRLFPLQARPVVRQRESVFVVAAVLPWRPRGRCGERKQPPELHAQFGLSVLVLGRIRSEPSSCGTSHGRSTRSPLLGIPALCDGRRKPRTTCLMGASVPARAGTTNHHSRSREPPRMGGDGGDSTSPYTFDPRPRCLWAREELSSCQVGVPLEILSQSEPE